MLRQWSKRDRVELREEVNESLGYRAINKFELGEGLRVDVDRNLSASQWQFPLLGWRTYSTWNTLLGRVCGTCSVRMREIRVRHDLD